MDLTYRCREGDMADWIAWKHYGDVAAVVALYEANPHLADLGPKLPAGTLVTLPVLVPPPTTRPVIRLWD